MVREGRPRLAHQPALDGIRGAAVAAVLLFHGGHLTGGYLGVDAFFVLSGFLITSLLLAEHSDRGTISLRHFWERRARRLLPAVLCVLVAVAAYAALVAKPDELATIRGDGLATLAYVANWRQIFTSNDYFALFRSPSPLQHTWSLAIEEQFYLVWPLVVLAIVRGKASGDAARRVLTWSIGLGLVSFAWMQVLYHRTDPSRVYYGTDTRAASILVGAALAALLTRRGPVQSRRARVALEAAAIVALAGLAVAWTRLDGNSPRLYRGGLFLCALAAAVVIAAGVHPERGPVARVLSWRPLCALGLVSYGVYLWHWPIFVYLNEQRVHLSGWPLFGVQVAVTLVVSYASYRIVERPIRHGFGNNALLRLTPAVAIVMVIVIVVSTNGAATPAASAASSSSSRGGVLVVGDSVARSLVPGLRDVGLPVTDASILGCRLVRGHVIGGPPSSEVNCPWATAWRQMVRKYQPRVVLLVSGVWDLFDIEPPGAKHALVPGTPAWNTYYADTLQRAINVLGAGGARVVIPTVPYTASLAFFTQLGKRSAFNPVRVRAANAVLREVISKNQRVATSPDLNKFLSPSGAYQPWLGNVKQMRTDGVHYSQQGADVVARWLKPWLTTSASTTSVVISGDPQADFLGLWTNSDARHLSRVGAPYVRQQPAPKVPALVSSG